MTPNLTQKLLQTSLQKGLQTPLHVLQHASMKIPKKGNRSSI